MASQQQFEGPVLEDLLERVRTEVGAGARIVAANRVRKGGIAGFFSRQAYEVLVEPVEGATAPRSATPRGAAAAPRSGAPRTTPATILDLADAVSEYERNNVIDLVDERTVSTETRGFAQLLDGFRGAIDATPEELVSDAMAQEDRARASAARDEMAYDDLTIDTEPPQPLPTEPVDAPPVIVDDDDLDLISSAPDFRLGNPPRNTTRRVVQANEIIDRYETRLSRMGLPARLIPRGVGSRELKGALVESLVQLPSAPSVPSGLGVVIVVVGASSAPVILARDLAVELDLDPDDVVLATRDHLGDGIPAWLQMNDPDTAYARRRSWQRRDQPTIVACSLPPMYQSLRWAREMLDQLEPTITWAIVDAGWKREDIAIRIDALGGVDVLALDNLDDTVSPASPLELGIPIGRLAREHASPLTWTEMFLERMQS